MLIGHVPTNARRHLPLETRMWPHAAGRRVVPCRGDRFSICTLVLPSRYRSPILHSSSSPYRLLLGTQKGGFPDTARQSTKGTPSWKAPGPFTQISVIQVVVASPGASALRT